MMQLDHGNAKSFIQSKQLMPGNYSGPAREKVETTLKVKRVIVSEDVPYYDEFDFLLENMGLILSEAKKSYTRFRGITRDNLERYVKSLKSGQSRSVDNADEYVNELIVLSIGALRQAKEYWNPTKQCKITTVLTWFLKKNFERARGKYSLRKKKLSCIECSQGGREVFLVHSLDTMICPLCGETYTPHDSGIPQIESYEDIDQVGDADQSSHHDLIPLNQEQDEYSSGDLTSADTEHEFSSTAYSNCDYHVPHYHVCIESFRPVLSLKDIQLLKYLTSNRSDDNKRRELIEEFGNANITRIGIAVRKRIQARLEKTDRTVYVAHCLNGCKNIVLVCAENEQDARSYLKPYGQINEIRTYLMDNTA